MSVNRGQRILIFGAGVIGGAYAVKFAQAGYNVTMLARGKRLHDLKEHNLRFHEKGAIRTVNVSVIERLEPTDLYDYIFVPVRYEQAESALMALKDNQSKNIVTMINNPIGYASWERIVGAGRIIPGFPSAGGEIKNGVLYAQFGPKAMQATMFGEINGQVTERLRALGTIFTRSKLPFTISKEMDAMQKTHVALVVALSKDLYTENGLKDHATATSKASVREMVVTLKNYLRGLEQAGVAITPSKLKILQLCPTWLLAFLLRKVMQTKMVREILFSDHAMNMKVEMEAMHQDLVKFLRENAK